MRNIFTPRARGKYVLIYNVRVCSIRFSTHSVLFLSTTGHRPYSRSSKLLYLQQAALIQRFPLMFLISSTHPYGVFLHFFLILWGVILLICMCAICLACFNCAILTTASTDMTLVLFLISAFLTLYLSIIRNVALSIDISLSCALCDGTYFSSSHMWELVEYSNQK